MLPTEYGPKFEEVLTIAVVVDHEVYGPGLHFVEYSEDLEGNPPVYPVREFRPLIDRDISLFAHHLETEKADA